MSKTKRLMQILLLIAVSQRAFAQSADNPFIRSVEIASRAGGVQGGGGDLRTEARIKEIRDDLLIWIKEGGAKTLRMPEGLTYDEYLHGTSNHTVFGMLDILVPGSVVVNSIDRADMRMDDPELNTYVDGKPKRCKGWISKRDGRPHLLCEAEKFLELSEAEQYRQIHHEYASLGLLEKNVGSDSDYFLSSQITDYLVSRPKLMLEVRPELPRVPLNPHCRVAFAELDPSDYPGYYKYMKLHWLKPRDVPELVRNKFLNAGYEIVKKVSQADFKVGMVRMDWNYGEDTIWMVQTHLSTGMKKVDLSSAIFQKDDPRRAALQAKLRDAKTIQEYMEAKYQLEHGKFYPTPGKTEFEALEVVKCADFYGVNEGTRDQ